VDAGRVVVINSAALSRSLKDRGYLGMSLTGQQAIRYRMSIVQQVGNAESFKCVIERIRFLGRNRVREISM
jgi:hypothetical protein